MSRAGLVAVDPSWNITRFCSRLLDRLEMNFWVSISTSLQLPSPCSRPSRSWRSFGSLASSRSAVPTMHFVAAKTLSHQHISPCNRLQARRGTPRRPSASKSVTSPTTPPPPSSAGPTIVIPYTRLAMELACVRTSTRTYRGRRTGSPMPVRTRPISTIE